MKSLPLLIFLAACPALADTATLATVDGGGVPEAQVRRLERVLEKAWQEESSWQWKPSVPTALDGPARRCASDLPCLVGKAQALGVDHAVLVELSALGRSVSVKAHLVDVVRAKVITRGVEDLKLDAAEPELLDLVQRMVPPQARRGFGSVWVEAAQGATLKVNGRRQPLTSQGLEVPVSAGRHEVDVTFKNGQSLLQLVEVPEGKRVRTSFEPPAYVVATGTRPSDTLRLTSYGLWSAAGVAFAAALTAGALSNYELRARGSPCEGADRTCPGLATAQAHQRQAQAFTRNANILAATGLILGVAGGGVFAWDFFVVRR